MSWTDGSSSPRRVGRRYSCSRARAVTRDGSRREERRGDRPLKGELWGLIGRPEGVTRKNMHRGDDNISTRRGERGMEAHAAPRLQQSLSRALDVFENSHKKAALESERHDVTAG